MKDKYRLERCHLLHKNILKKIYENAQLPLADEMHMHDPLRVIRVIFGKSTREAKYDFLYQSFYISSGKSANRIVDLIFTHADKKSEFIDQLLTFVFKDPAEKVVFGLTECMQRFVDKVIYRQSLFDAPPLKNQFYEQVIIRAVMRIMRVSDLPCHDLKNLPQCLELIGHDSFKKMEISQRNYLFSLIVKMPGELLLDQARQPKHLSVLAGILVTNALNCMEKFPHTTLVALLGRFEKEAVKPDSFYKELAVHLRAHAQKDQLFAELEKLPADEYPFLHRKLEEMKVQSRTSYKR